MCSKSFVCQVRQLSKSISGCSTLSNVNWSKLSTTNAMVRQNDLLYDSRSIHWSSSRASHDHFWDSIVFKIGNLLKKRDQVLLPEKVLQFIDDNVKLMRPDDIHICDGSEHEAQLLFELLCSRGQMNRLTAYENNYICRTNPRDVGRVERKTWIVTEGKNDVLCHVTSNEKSIMGNWMSNDYFADQKGARFPNCMKGRTMYVIPFSLGPIGGPLSKIGVQLTDSAYVAVSMRIMTRVSDDVWEALGENDFVKCVHSVGVPLSKSESEKGWACNPDQTIIAHLPREREIWSFGSGYGDNSLLGKKCFSLRIASHVSLYEGWLAEHMLIIGVTGPDGQEHFIAGGFPSAFEKTNLAMLNPTMPGWKVRCIGDDIAWMKFGSDGRLYGINPETGFFGVAPGTSLKTNPQAVKTFQKNSIFTNVAETVDGQYFWEGLEEEIKNPDIEMINWCGEKWRIGDKGLAAHPNAHFTCPASQCPIMHPKWEAPEGVPIDAFIFGAIRPEGVPLIYEAFSWKHGVFTASCLKSQAPAAPEIKNKELVHDPMAMRPFMGYNFGMYLQHWLDLGKKHEKASISRTSVKFEARINAPKIFHVNWSRKNTNGENLWPGFGENIRVIDWIIRRLNDDEEIGVRTPIGIVPKVGSINLDGLASIDWHELMSVPKDYWVNEVKELRTFLHDQVGHDLPHQISDELEELCRRVSSM